MVAERIQKIIDTAEHILYNDVIFFRKEVIDLIVPPANPVMDHWIWKGDVNNYGWPFVEYKGGRFKKKFRIGVRQLILYNYARALDTRNILMTCRGLHSDCCVNPYHYSVGPLGPSRKTALINAICDYGMATDYSNETILEMKWDRFNGMSFADISAKYGISRTHAVRVNRGWSRHGSFLPQDFDPIIKMF